MSDRLRFRVFYKVGKDWVNVTKNVPFILDHYGRLIKHGDFPVHPIDYPERFIVEQCTGLKDKNGNLIYEGDLLTDGTDIGTVIWTGTGWGCTDFLFTKKPETLEICGNIHEQAEQKDK